MAKKIKMSLSKSEEQKLDKEARMDDNFSIVMIIIILVLCFIVGITLGFLLYQLAITGGI